MKQLYLYLFLAFTLIFTNCSIPTTNNNNSPAAPDRPLAKFEPQDGKVLLFVGQEMEAIGGLDDYNDGYLDHFERPAGFTMYSNLSPGDTSFGHIYRGLDGINQTDDWGDHKSNMSLQLADESYDNMALAIGLSFVNHEERVASGEHDSLIVELGKFIKSLGDRPVFLRAGYEFDGYAWNFYDREAHIGAFRRIKDVLDSIDVDNYAMVWQSTGWVSTMEHLESWYPGDEYVDWCAYSFFSRFDEAKMIEFAREKGKPVFIAEASPTVSDYTVKFDGQTKEIILSKPEQAEEAWERWFVPFFNTIEDNPDVVKAVSYINCYWLSHPMWFDNPTFQKVDARLQTSDELTRKWKEKTSEARYILSTESLYNDLKESSNE